MAAAAISLALGPAPARAQAAAAAVPDWRDCVRIDDALSRLSCYDAQAGRIEGSAGAVVPAVPAVPAAPAASGAGSPSAPDPAPAVPRRGASVPAAAVRTPEFENLQPSGAGPLSRAIIDVRRSLGTSLSDRWELDDAFDRGRFVLRPYKPMYVLAADWTSSRNRLPTSPNPNNVVTAPLTQRSVEAKFQISLKTKVWEDMLGSRGDLWLGYTQTSYWQIYDSGGSRPFRESNYEPEVMAVFPTNYSLFGWQGRLAGLALNHQSNGRDEPYSRSWNRIVAQFGFERGDWMMMIRPWWRIPESAGSDDNPDISDYIGRADLLLVRKSEGHELSLLARHTLRGGDRSRGALQLDYAFPITSYFKAHLQIFTGYGATLIDYNHRQTRVGLGISLVQWL
ncbi:MAG: phospholipase A [Lautropia sp.]